MRSIGIPPVRINRITSTAARSRKKILRMLV
jgi:hypothetical protein